MKQHSKVYKQITVIMRSSSAQRSQYSCQYHVYIHTSVELGHGYFTHYRGAELLKVWTRIDLLQWSLDTRINLLQWSLATCIYILQWSSIPNSFTLVYFSGASTPVFTCFEGAYSKQLGICIQLRYSTCVEQSVSGCDQQ